MTEPLLDAATIAELQDTRLRGLLVPGLTAGGSSWQAETTTGDGVTATRSGSLGASYTGYTEQVAKTRDAAPLYDTEWQHVVTDASPPTLTAGQIIRSTTTTHAFRIIGPILDPLYPTYAVDQIQGE